MKSLKQLTALCFIGILIVLTSCSSNQGKIDIAIHQELQTNTTAFSYLNEYSASAQKFNNNINELLKLTGGKNIDNSSELSGIQKLKMAKLAIQMTMIGKSIEEIENQQDSIANLLNNSEAILFAQACQQIKNQMTRVDKSSLNISEKEMLAQQKAEETKKNEEGQLIADFEKAQKNMTPEERLAHETRPESKSKNVHPAIAIPFILLVFSLFIFTFIKRAKAAKNTITDIGYAIGKTKSLSKDLLKNPEAFSKNGKQISNDEKKNIENLLNTLDKK